MEHNGLPCLNLLEVTPADPALMCLIWRGFPVRDGAMEAASRPGVLRVRGAGTPIAIARTTVIAFAWTHHDRRICRELGEPDEAQMYL